MSACDPKQKISFLRSINQSVNLDRRDFMILVGLMALAAITVLVIVAVEGNAPAAKAIDERWFQSDGWRVYDDMLVFEANHYRNAMRPMFSLITMPIAVMLKALLGLRGIQSIFLVNAFFLSIWTALLYLILRTLDIARSVAVTTGVAGLLSGAVLFWIAVPETYPLSSTVILFCILLAALQTKTEVPKLLLIISGALSCGTLLTNFLPSLLTNFVFKKIKSAFFISFSACFIVMMAWGIQRIIFPKPASNPIKSVVGEKAYILAGERGSSLDVLRSAMVSPMLVPKVTEYDTSVERTGKRLTIQQSPILDSGFFYVLLMVFWMGLLCRGAFRMISNKSLWRFNLVFFGTLLGELFLHLLYGEETFLYSLHFFPLLAVIGSFGLSCANRRREIVIGLAFVLFAGINNVERFHDASTRYDFSDPDARLTRLDDEVVNG